MKYKNHILVCIVLMLSFSVFPQQGKQKRADTLFNKFSFVKAAEVYKDLIQKEGFSSGSNNDYRVDDDGNRYPTNYASVNDTFNRSDEHTIGNSREHFS